MSVGITPVECLNLSRRYRYQDLHEKALDAAIAGVVYVPRDDPLYHMLKAEIATSGYYSTDPKMRELGHAACEELTLARDCNPAARHIAFQNLFHYTKKLSDYAPSFHAERVELDAPAGYYPTNPSICRDNAAMVMNVRCVNYFTDTDEKVVHPANESFRTRNFLLEVYPSLRWNVIGEIMAPSDLPRMNEDMPLGVEDVRLFRHRTHLWASGTVVQANADKMAEIMVALIPPSLMMSQQHIFRDLWSTARHQKNWSPIIENWPGSAGSAPLLYSHDPLRLVKIGAPICDRGTPPIAAHTWSGSTQAIPWEDGYLVMIHEKTYNPEMKYTRRWYQQRFVWYDRGWNLRKISRRFQFDNGETEFPCGMCIHPDGKRLVISYGVLDREAWLATVNIDEVEGMLCDVGES